MTIQSENERNTSSVLSYFEEYFTPDADAPLSGHSTGQIARHIHSLLDRRGTCQYVPQQPVGGLRADVFVGHFWSFLDYCRHNTFERAIAVYPIADSLWTTALLKERAATFGVPMPWWDLPPASFDHRATMEAADAVIVVGNRFTLHTYAPEHRRKIVLVNYAADTRLLPATEGLPPPESFCYVATHCDLRKGFMDALQTWDDLGADGPSLHVIGATRPPWDRLLAGCRGHVTYHGFVNSKEPRYASTIAACRFAYLPTYSEGQVGTLVEAIHLGCVPITTLASGLPEEVLAHCIIVESGDIDGQRRAIRDAAAWSDDMFAATRGRLRQVADRLHDWARFEDRVGSLVDRLAGVAGVGVNG